MLTSKNTKKPTKDGCNENLNTNDDSISPYYFASK